MLPWGYDIKCYDMNGVFGACVVFATTNDLSMEINNKLILTCGQTNLLKKKRLLKKYVLFHMFHVSKQFCCRDQASFASHSGA